jgi:hypothetical protein
MRKFPKLKLWDKIHVKWVDSAHETGWKHIDKIKDLDVCKCESVGMFLHQDASKIIVALNVADKEMDYASFDSTMSIPIPAVTKITKLK